GLVQGLVAPRIVPLGRWVVANAIGWAPAMAVILWVASAVGEDWHLGVNRPRRSRRRRGGGGVRRPRHAAGTARGLVGGRGAAARAELIEPAGQVRGMVLVIQSWWGLTDG